MRVLCVGEWQDRSTLEKIGRRFMTEGDLLPETGIELLSRLHDPGAKKLWVLAEVDDVSVLQTWFSTWSDYIDFSVHPVIDDEECMQMLQNVLDG